MFGMEDPLRRSLQLAPSSISKRARDSQHSSQIERYYFTMTATTLPKFLMAPILANLESMVDVHLEKMVSEINHSHPSLILSDGSLHCVQCNVHIFPLPWLLFMDLSWIFTKHPQKNSHQLKQKCCVRRDMCIHFAPCVSSLIASFH